MWTCLLVEMIREHTCERKTNADDKPSALFRLSLSSVKRNPHSRAIHPTMAVSSRTPPRFHLSLHLQDPARNSSPGGKKTRAAPTTETLRRRLLRRGVSPTPKILHTLRKKEALKALRRARKHTAAAAAAASLSPRDEEIAAEEEEETRFRAAAAEYRALVGRPWDAGARGVAPPCGWDGEDGGLEGLREMLVARRGDGFRWLLDDDIETEPTEPPGRKQQKRPGTGWDVDAEDEERRIELLVSRYFCACHFRISRIIHPA